LTLLPNSDGGDLAALIRGPSRALNDRAIHGILLQVSAGLSALHAKQVVHRDLKPENILLTSEGVVKIADLGVSTALTASLPSTSFAAGSIPFMAPECRRFILGEEVQYGVQADVWSLGALAYAMCTANPVPNIAKVGLPLPSPTLPAHAPLRPAAPVIAPPRVDRLGRMVFMYSVSRPLV
jgi:serine/threonine protein kinase